jgi:gas vesicle protein
MPKKLKESIIKDLGIDQLPEDKREEVLLMMTEALLKRILIVALEKIPGNKKEEFDKIFASKDSEKINEFLSDNIPDYEKMVKNEIENFKNEIKETVNQLRK